MERGIFFRVILILLLVAAFFGLAVLAYNTGVHQGILVGAQVAAGAPAAGSAFVPVAPPYAMMPYWGPYYGFPGMAFFPCLGGLFLFFLFFFVLRGLFWGWGGHRGMHYRMGGWGSGPDQPVPSRFHEWHQQDHAGQTAQPEQK